MSLLSWLKGLFVRKRMLAEGAKAIDEAVAVAGKALAKKNPTLGDFYDAIRTGNWEKVGATPKPGCPHCGGRGNMGWDVKTKRPVPCRCVLNRLRKMDKERWIAENRRRVESMSLCEWKCKGACCKSGVIVILPHEVDAMKRAGRWVCGNMVATRWQGKPECDPRWDRWVPLKLGGDRYVAVLRRKEDEYCVYHSLSGCILGSLKPLICRIYPFWHTKELGIFYDRNGMEEEIGEACPVMQLPMGAGLADLKLDEGMVKAYTDVFLLEARNSRGRRKRELKRMLELNNP